MPYSFTYKQLVAYLRRTGWTYDESSMFWRHPDTFEVVCVDSNYDLGRGLVRASILGVLGRLKARDQKGPDLPEEELTRLSSDPQAHVDSST